MKKSHKRYVICGYYGQGNLGDEAILRVILKQIKEENPHADIRVLKSKKTLSAARDMISADLFIFGGGSILQNATSNASLFYYLAIIHLANLLCKRKIMLSNGLGPIIERKIPEKTLLFAISRAVNCFNFISVRDTNSQKFLQTLLPHRKIHLIPDPALIDFANINQELENLPQNTPTDDFFIFCPHFHSLRDAKITPEKLSKCLGDLSRSLNSRVKIVIFNEKEDSPLAREVQKRLENVEIFVPQTARDAARTFHRSKFVISGRYHGALLAASLNLPTLSVSNDPKLTALCQELSLFTALNPEILKNPHALHTKILDLINHHKENHTNIAQKIKLSAKKSKEYLKKAVK